MNECGNFSTAATATHWLTDDEMCTANPVMLLPGNYTIYPFTHLCSLSFLYYYLFYWVYKMGHKCTS